MSSTSNFYNQNASSLAEQYNSTTFENVHASWQPFWPHAGDRVLDVGAGSGRDAKWMMEQGCEVIALEPAASLLALGKVKTGDSVTWLDDALPALEKTTNLGLRFDLILEITIPDIPIFQVLTMRMGWTTLVCTDGASS